MPPGGQQAIQVVAAPGEQNNTTVRATDPATSTDAAGWPLTVTVTGQNAAFDTAPPSGDLPCQIVDAHTANCSAPADTYFTQAIVWLGDGNNHLQFATESVPLREEFNAGDGNDDISTGPFAGDASWRLSASLWTPGPRGPRGCGPPP